MDKMHKFRPIIVEEESGGSGLQWELYQTHDEEFVSDDSEVDVSDYYPSHPLVRIDFETLACEGSTDQCDVVNELVYATLRGTVGSKTTIIMTGDLGLHIYPSGDSNAFAWKVRVKTYVLNNNGNVCNDTYMRNLPKLES